MNLSTKIHVVGTHKKNLNETVHLRNEFNFWNIHGIMNTSDLLQSKLCLKGFTLTLQVT